MKNLKTTLKVLSVFLLTISTLSAQKDIYGDLYFPDADAAADIQKAIDKAANDGKHVLLQIGGNWCGWCYALHDFVEKDEEIKALVEKNYVTLRVNYSRENENEAVLATYGYPQRFGFPVLIVLDQKGNRLHTQDTGLLEEGEGYNRRHVKSFFESWTPKAIAPESYLKTKKG